MAVAGSRLDFSFQAIQFEFWTAAATAGRRSFCYGPALFVSGPALCVGAALLLCVGARRSVSGPAALCVGARRFVSGPGGPLSALSVSGLGAVSGPALFVSGPGALCRGRRSFYVARRCVSGPAALCVGALCRESASGPGGPLPRLYFPGTGGLCVLSVCLSVCQDPTICVSGARRSLCRGGAGPALFVSGPGALCVGARRSFYRTPELSVRVSLFRRSLCVRTGALCQGGVGDWVPVFLRLRRSLEVGARLVSGPGLSVVCVGARRSSPGALCVGARRSVSERGALCVGARRFVSGPGGPLPALVSGPGAFCAGARRFVSAPGAPSLCRGPALCVGARRSLCRGPVRGPALFVSGPGALCVGALCQGVFGARIVSVSELGALVLSLCREPELCVGVCVGARGSGGVGVCIAVSVSRQCLCRGSALFVSGPGALCRPHPAPPIRATHPTTVGPSSNPRAAPIRVPPTHPVPRA